MSNEALIASPIGVVTVLLAAVAVADALGRLRSMKRVGAAVIVIFIGAALANLRIIPSAAAGGAVYGLIFQYGVPLAIFLMLLNVNLCAIRRAGPVMLGAFALGALGTFAGVWVATEMTPLRAMTGDLAPPLAGMFAGTYIGGGANFNAIAVAFDVTHNSGVYTAATVVDNVMTDVWIIITLAMPAFLARFSWFARRAAARTEPAAPVVKSAAPLSGTLALAAPLALAFAAIWFSDAAASRLAAAGIVVPSILIVVTLALIAAQFPLVQRLDEAGRIGLWTVFLFLAVVGANADIAALIASGQLAPVLFVYVLIILVVHGVILLGAGALLRIEPVVLAIASSANIGGSATAFVLAEAEERHDLVLPAILIGSIGNAIGAYAGFAMAALVG